MEQSLLRSLNDLHIRSQVENTLKEMITDVELAHSLQEELSARFKINQLQRQIVQQESMWEEAKVVEEERRSVELEVADKLVLELWALSRELGELQAIKVQHRELMLQHDEVVAKLIQTEEELADVKLNTVRQRTKVEAEDADEEAPSLEARPEPPADDAMEETERALERDSSEQLVTVKEAKPMSGEEPGVSAVVVAIDDDEPDVPQLAEFEATILMHVFSYLDALDILNTAQVNISMYSRVDSLFGLGHSDGATNSSTVEPEKTMSTGNSPSTQPSTATASTNSDSTSAATSKVTSSAVHGPTVVKIPPSCSPGAAMVDMPPTAGASKLPAPSPGASKPDSATPTSPEKPAATTATSASFDTSGSMSPTRGGLALFSSILNPRTKITASGPSASVIANPPESRSAGAAEAAMQFHHRRSASADSPHQRQQQEKHPMNAAMANSMAAKLSDAELNAIILMTDRLKQKESLADRLLKENDRWMAKLEGAEAVKDFLIAKVRDMEQAISNSEENDAKVAQQIASDQEVIAFLDARVQELEKKTRRLEAEKQATMEEKNQTKTHMSKKIVVLEDMLQFERERLNENEVEWKATKKLLVKEVKSLRAQIVALLAERDGIREQNEHLRKAVVSSSPSRASMLRQGS